MKRFLLIGIVAAAAAMLVSCEKKSKGTDTPDPVTPNGSITIKGETYNFDRCVCFYEFDTDGKAMCSLFFSNFEVGTQAGTNVPSGERVDMFHIYYKADSHEVRAGDIIYGLNASDNDMAWLSIMATGGVSTGSTQNCENGYIYSEGTDLNGDVNHPSFKVETDGVNFKFSADNICMTDLFGTYCEDISFVFEGQIEYKTADQWELTNTQMAPYILTRK